MKQKILCCGITILQLFAIVYPGDGRPNGTEDRLIVIPLEASNAFNASTKDKELLNLCSTPSCDDAAQRLLLNMDQSVDPCDNFYRFACGGFLNSTIIPKDESQVNPRTSLNDKTDHQLRAVIDQPLSADEIKAFKFAKNLYKLCMDTSTIERQGLKLYLEIIKQKGGWPVVKNTKWNETELTIKKATIKLFSLKINLDVKNRTKKIIALDQPTLGLSQKYFSNGIDDKIVNAYYNYMIDIAVIFGAERKQAESELKEVLLFEMKIANISLSSEKRRNKTLLHNPMTVGEFSETYPFVPLEFIIKKKFSSVLIPKSEVIDVIVPDYFKDLEGALKNVTTRTLANYAMWKEVRSNLVYLNEAVRERQVKFLGIITGRTENRPRWRKCMAIVKSYFPHVVGALYVRNYVSEDTKKNVEKIVVNIRNEFNKILQKTEWMDEETRIHALEKVKYMSSYVGYSQELRNDTKIEEIYRGLVLSENYFLGNIFVLDKFFEDIEFKNFRKAYTRDWKSLMSPVTVNARYSPRSNCIQIPAGILQGVFFNKDLPKYMNYGAIGFIVGHEITHGFDDKGRQFDKNGNLVDWWKPETEEKFFKKSQCVINQYNNYIVQEIGLNINGDNTQGENIADIGGIKQAYLAYSNWSDKNQPEPSLLGFQQYTSRQMFWISAANVRCKKMRLEALKNHVINNVHSPDEFRVIGPLSNMPEFSQDFNCPANSRMSPSNRCTVW